MGFFEAFSGVVIAIVVLGLLAIFTLAIRLYRRVPQGMALIRNSPGGAHVSFHGALVLPFIHKAEIMDITVKRIEIARAGSDGLICKDNLRADIKVAFFVRVNKTADDVRSVADILGVDRASDQNALIGHFDAKFSEALKTVGKRFNFVELYEARDHFKREVTGVIGEDLDGYRLIDCAIDYLEQTEITNLNPDNILDAEGIKKITELTSTQKILANQIDRDREKTIKRQNVEAEEAVLELDRQLTEKQERQKREVAAVKAREAAEAHKIQQEERLKAEGARIRTEEELSVAEQNKQRQVIVAEKNKQRTEAIENERIIKDQQLEQTERERVVDLARIEKERAIESERKNIQDVIRERVAVEKTVVEEEEKIKDTRAVAEAERTKKVTVVAAERDAEESRVKLVVKARAEKESAEQLALQKVIEAEADQKAADKSAEARKLLAEAAAAEAAATGLAEVKVAAARAEAKEREGSAQAFVIEKVALAQAQAAAAKAGALRTEGAAEAEVIEKKALAAAKAEQAQGAAEAEVIEKKALAAAKAEQAQGSAEAEVIEKKALAAAKADEAQGSAAAVVIEKKAQAEAKGIELKAGARRTEGGLEAEVLEQKALAQARAEEAAAAALEKTGSAEANNLLKKFQADAQGIRDKAEAMKLFDPSGRAHEEFKLVTERDRQLALAQIEMQKSIAAAQAEVLSAGLQSAKIEIIGGESMFLDKLLGSVTQAKSVDHLVGGSKVLNDVKNTFFNGDPAYFKSQLHTFIDQFGLDSEDIKNLSISAAIHKMMNATADDRARGVLSSILGWAEKLGLDATKLDDFRK